jgi:chaperone modulatory protein CbpM
MITVTGVCRVVPGLTEADLVRWIEADWVRPVRLQGEPVFSDGDVARVRLILDLRALLDVEEATLPVVLSLMDQLYATRWQLRRVLEEAGPEVVLRLGESVE